MISIGQMYIRQIDDNGTFSFVGFLRTKDPLPDRKLIGVTFMANRLELDVDFLDELQGESEMTLDEIVDTMLYHKPQTEKKTTESLPSLPPSISEKEKD